VGLGRLERGLDQNSLPKNPTVSGSPIRLKQQTAIAKPSVT
jgi:hypothetical protein